MTTSTTALGTSGLAQTSYPACPVCDATRTRPFSFNLREGSRELPLLECPACSFIFVPDAASDAARHGTDFHDTRAQATESTVYTVSILYCLWHWSRVLHWTGSTRILDVGCADGRLLDMARTMGFQAEGIDVSDHDAARWKAHGLTASASLAEDYAKTHAGLFDVVIARVVIEHVANPRSFLTACAAMLKPGGHCLIETGDARSPLARALGPKWSVWVPEEGIGAHVSFFSRRSAEVLGQRCGLRLRDSVPVYSYTPFSMYREEKPGRGNDPATLLKFLIHRSRLAAGRCFWFEKPAR